MSEKEKLIITDWALEDRPREKLMMKGIHTLSNAELIAILIGSGNKRETAVDVGQRIIKSVNNNLNLLGKRSVNELVSAFEGIGSAKAISIIAALELGRRRKSEDAQAVRRLQCSTDLYHFFFASMADLNHEEFWVVLLNNSNRVIDSIKISQGGISSTTVDVRMIVKPAVERLASAIVLWHNHPSGNLNPSHSDDEVTKKIKNAAALFDIRLLDHLILCENGYYSYADEGKLF